MIEQTPIEQAIKDLGSIKALRANEAFNDFFLRRLDEKIEATKLLILSARSLSGEDLINLRYGLWAQQELRSLLDTEEASCQKLIDQG